MSVLYRLSWCKKIMIKVKREIILVALLFFVISVFVIYGVVFNDKSIGRSLDFPVPPVDYLVKNNYLMNFYSWWGTMNGGARNSFGGALIPVNSVLYFPLLFGAGTWFIGRYQILLTLFAAMFSFYLLSRRLLESYDAEEKNKIILSILGSLFFTLNNYFFSEIIFGSNAQYLTFSLSPLLAYAVLSYFKFRRKRYFLLSFFSLLVMSSTLQHLVLAYAIIILFSLVYRNYKFFAQLAFFHVLLSLYWILPLLYTAPDVLSTEAAADYSQGLISSSSKLYSAIINSEYFANRNLYNLALNNKYLSFIWFFNAFVLFGVSLTSLFNYKFFKKKNKELIMGFSLILMASLFFVKGGREPFGNVVLHLYKTIPFLSLYRSLQHYLSFYTISISVLFLFSALFLVKRNKNFLYLLFVPVLVNAMPWWYTRDLGAKNIPATNKAPSYFSQFHLTKGNDSMYALNNLPLDFGVMHIPPGHSINFFAVGKNEFDFIKRVEGKIKSQGSDTGLFYGNKKFYATDGPANRLSDVLNNLELDMYAQENFFQKNKNLLVMLGTRYMVMRDDAGPVFPMNAHSFNVENMKEAIAKSDIFSFVKNEDFITIAKFKDLLPHFYAPQKVILSEATTTEALPIIVSDPNYETRSVIYFKQDPSFDAVNLERLESLPDSISNAPILEFKKLNPTKYRVRVHGLRAEENIPLVFSESFHRGWRAYLLESQISNSKSQVSNLSNYQILDGNDDDQADKRELQDHVDKGWVSDLGNGKEKTIKHYKYEDGKQKFGYAEKYSIDFISKNFNGTVQNDNLPEGKIWETWFKKPISEENHLVANGYANSWIINYMEICSGDNSKCVKNSEGSYDLELVVEFWPQRLFYLGSGISGGSLLICLGYISFIYVRVKRRKTVENKI